MSGRRAVILDGPYDGHRAPPIPDTWPWPPSHCVNIRGGGWQHHEHMGGGRYRWIGPCAEVDHDGPGLDEWRCCCGRDGCDGSGPA